MATLSNQSGKGRKAELFPVFFSRKAGYLFHGSCLYRQILFRNMPVKTAKIDKKRHSQAFHFSVFAIYLMENRQNLPRNRENR